MLRDTVDKSQIKASNDLKCYVKCKMRKSAVLSRGKLNVDRLVKLSNFNNINVTISRAAMCKAKMPKAKSCEEVWSLFVCIFGNGS